MDAHDASPPRRPHRSSGARLTNRRCQACGAVNVTEGPESGPLFALLRCHACGRATWAQPAWPPRWWDPSGEGT